MELSHVCRGNGPPLVLVHGTGGSHDAWGPLMPMLARERRVFAVDLPGFGDSPPLPDGAPPTVPALAVAVAEWMGGRGLERPHVAGNSLGGAIALELAKGHSVASAAALSPLGFDNRLEYAYAAASLRLTRLGARITSPLAPALFGNPVLRTLALWQAMARPWRMPKETAISGCRALAAAPAFGAVIRAARDYRFEGPLSGTPVAIGWGERDRILFPRQAARARDAVPEARFVSLPGCGHVPMTDDPERVAGLLLETSEAR